MFKSRPTVLRFLAGRKLIELKNKLGPCATNLLSWIVLTDIRWFFRAPPRVQQRWGGQGSLTYTWSIWHVGKKWHVLQCWISSRFICNLGINMCVGPIGPSHHFPQLVPRHQEAFEGIGSWIWQTIITFFFPGGGVADYYYFFFSLGWGGPYDYYFFYSFLVLSGIATNLVYGSFFVHWN